MHLLSVNVGRASPVQNGKLSRQTGIYKFPVPGPTAVMREGLDGDDICDSKNHGGVDQALYVYGAPDYEWWSKALGRELPPGTFGENLTISDLVSAHIWIGDRLHIGTVTLEVTAPRVPCRTLSTRMGDAGFVKRFREAERPGLYCRVIHEGIVRAGQPSRWNGIPESPSLPSKSFATSTPPAWMKLPCGDILPPQLRFETGARSKLNSRSFCSKTTVERLNPLTNKLWFKRRSSSLCRG